MNTIRRAASQTRVLSILFVGFLDGLVLPEDFLEKDHIFLLVLGLILHWEAQGAVVDGLGEHQRVSEGLLDEAKRNVADIIVFLLDGQVFHHIVEGLLVV